MGQMVLRTIPYLGHYSIRIRLSAEIDHNIEEKARTNKIDSCALSHRWKWKVAAGNQKQPELVRQITAVLLLYNMNPTVHPDEAVRLCHFFIVFSFHFPQWWVLMVFSFLWPGVFACQLNFLSIFVCVKLLENLFVPKAQYVFPCSWPQQLWQCTIDWHSWDVL